jgi:hypothetical protein
MGCYVLLSVVSSPLPLPTSPSAQLAHHFTCLRLCLSGLEGQGRAPPPHTPTPMDNSEAAAADLEDSLKLGGHEYDS